MDYLIEKQYDRSPFEGYFKGSCFIGCELHSLFAHRFESAYMYRVLGKVENLAHHEALFRQFLELAFEKKITMDWTLGLYFLYWAQSLGLLSSIEPPPERIILRAVRRWINGNHRDLKYTILVISNWPGASQEYWLLGKKSEDPFQKPKVYKMPHIGERLNQNKITYTLLTEPHNQILEWNYINW